MLFGDVTRTDCQNNTADALDLPQSLYSLVCSHDGHWLVDDPDAAQPFIEQRAREAEILNSKLRSRSRGRATTYGTDSIVILDCPSAYGGICVLSDMGRGRYIRIDKFMTSTMAQEILYQPPYFLEAQIPSPTTLALDFTRRPLHEDVLSVAEDIRFSRFIFDNPQIKEYISEAILFGARMFVNLMKSFLMNR